MSKIVVVGLVGQSVFLLVDKFHTGGETVKAKSLHIEPGGKGFNQAIAARRFGAEVSFIAAIGNDGYRQVVENFLIKEGIKPILFEKDDISAFASIITDKKGANRVTEYIGAELTVDDIARCIEVITAADILIIGNEVPEKVNAKAVKIAKSNGVKVICNPAPQRKLSKVVKDNVDIFTPNQHEIVGLEDKDNVLVTLGGDGCLIKNLNVQLPATNDKPVDTTGAGDTFNGVLAAMLAEGKTLLSAVDIAMKASGNSVTKKGAASSIPYRNEILDR